MARDGIHLQCRTENGRVALINAGSDQAKRLIGKLMPVTFTEAMPHSLRGELMIQE
jgi:tRNA-2-methylthio-N6-dimethylallyladenosine synthase